MRYGVLGASGFIGSAVSDCLTAGGNEVMPFGRDGADTVDVLVNCAGVTKRYHANAASNSLWDQEREVLERINAIRCKHLIHISSIDAAVRPHSGYGRLKLRMEDAISWTKDPCTILRLPMVVGPGLKKNVIFDVIHYKPLYQTMESTYNVIQTYQIADAVSKCAMAPHSRICHVTACDCISVRQICEILQRSPVSIGTVTEQYERFDIPTEDWLECGISHRNITEFYNEHYAPCTGDGRISKQDACRCRRDSVL